MSKPNWKPPKHVERMRKHQEEKEMSENYEKAAFENLEQMWPKLVDLVNEAFENLQQTWPKLVDMLNDAMLMLAEFMIRFERFAQTNGNKERMIKMLEYPNKDNNAKVQEIVEQAEKVNAEINELNAKIEAEENPAEVARLTKEFWDKQDEYGKLWNAYCIAVGVMY